MGGCFMSLLHEGDYSTRWENFPLRHILGVREGIALRFLRQSANYLGTGVVRLVERALLRGLSRLAKRMSRWTKS